MVLRQKHHAHLLTVSLSILSLPFVTGFVLLGNTKATLPATPGAPEVEFLYDPNTDVPSLSNKEEIADGAYRNLSDAQLVPILIQIAMDQWNSVRGSYLRLILDTSSGPIARSREDRINVIAVESSDNLSSAAFATPEITSDDPTTISDCDISMSKRNVSALSFLTTLTHELGHCVGLGHPHSNYGAIMSYSRSGDSFRLGVDDKAGAIYLYPDEAYVDSSPKELISCGSLGASQTSRSQTAVLFL